MGTLRSPAVLGTVIAIGLVWALAALLWNGPGRLRRISVATVVLAVPALYATFTRAPIIAALLVSSAIVALSPRVRWPAVVLLAATAVGVIVSWGSFESSNVYEQRFGRVDTAETRLALQEASFAAARERPLFGWGYASFDHVKQVEAVATASADDAVLTQTSHNSFLTILVEFGTVGLALLLIPWIAIALAALRQIRTASTQRWIYVGVLGTIVVYGLNASIIDMRFFSFLPALFWLLLGLGRRTLLESRTRIQSD